jgi:hypothetical protein
MREWRPLGDGGYHGISEPMRELISVNLNASYRALWSDGDSELDRLFVPYGQSNIVLPLLLSNPALFLASSRRKALLSSLRIKGP